MTNCPICSNKRAIGKVGAEQYFCWDCCVEFVVRGDVTTVFNVQPDGTLVPYFEQADHAM